MFFFKLSILLWIGWLGPAPSAQAQDGPASPPRSSCVDIPGHVTCERAHNGLIHGVTVNAPEFTLQCRAFRQLWIKRYRGSSSRAETREVVVAGVCDQRALDGSLIKRWSTLEPLETKEIDRSLWSTADQELPEPVVTLISQRRKSGRITKFFSAYYLPAGWTETAFNDADAPAGFEPFAPLGSFQAWRGDEDKTSVISPLFEGEVECSDGFVVCTPYLKILHPNPELSEVEVEMVSGRLFFNHRSKKSSNSAHSLRATFLRESFGPGDPVAEAR